MSVLPQTSGLLDEIKLVKVEPGEEAPIPMLSGYYLQVIKGNAQLIDPLGRMQTLRPGQRIALEPETGWKIWNEHVSQDLEFSLAA
ncbi:MAG: hypothetical protein AAFY36_15640 [Bacteroidota bacterium]